MIEWVLILTIWATGEPVRVEVFPGFETIEACMKAGREKDDDFSDKVYTCVRRPT